MKPYLIIIIATFIATLGGGGCARAEPIRILMWNIESDGANYDVIADQLKSLGDYDIYGFTEVRPREWPAIRESLDGRFDVWYSHSGGDDRTAFAIDRNRFDILEKKELKSFGKFLLNPGNYRSPHIYRLRDRATDVELLIMINHLARGRAELRQSQADGLHQWAQEQSLPIVAIGDYNFDYVYATERGNEAFNRFVRDDVWRWVRPDEPIDSNWFDGDGDGRDDYPGSILDFGFVAGAAKDWPATSRVIVRPGDFPDDATTSDHRPVELIVTPTPAATVSPTTTTMPAMKAAAPAKLTIPAGR